MEKLHNLQQHNYRGSTGKANAAIMNRYLTLGFVLAILIGCNGQSEKQVGLTTREFTPVKYNFYVDQEGNIYEKKFPSEEEKSYFDSTLFFPEYPQRVPLKEVVDIDSYEEFKRSPFSKDKKNVYFMRATPDEYERYIVKGANSNTFTPLDYLWGKDDRNLFLENEIIEVADVNKNIQKYTPVKYDFYIDEEGNLYEKKLLRIQEKSYFDSTMFFPDYPQRIALKDVIDIDSYEELKDSPFSKDKNNVYFSRFTSYGLQRFIVEGANPKTFTPLNHVWGKDDTHVYWGNEIAEEASVNNDPDKSNCLDFYGEGGGCGYYLVCPGHPLYGTTVFLNRINDNIASNNKKIPMTCCRRYDTLSLEKEIYLIEICWGGSKTETWIYQKNEKGKFTSRKHGFMGRKLKSKTNGVHNFLLHEHSAPSYAIMHYTGQQFDTLQVIWCDWYDEEKTQRKWNCWNEYDE